MSESSGKRVKVEVVKIMGAGKCSADLHRVGQQWVVADSVLPPGMCSHAYDAIGPFLTALRFGGRFPWKAEPVASVCCPDADNPVVFRLSLEEDDVEAPLRARVREYEKAYNAGDAESLAAIYAADGSHTYAFGITHRGRAEIARGMQEQLAGALKGTSIAITPLRIRPLGPDLAVHEAAFSLRGLRDGAGAELPEIAGLCLSVYRKEGDQWYAEAVQCMVPPPLPGLQN